MSRCLLCCFDRAGPTLVVGSGEVMVVNDSGGVEGQEQYLQETLGMPASERRLVQDTAELIFSQMHLEKKSVTFLIAFFKRYPHHQRYFKAFRNIPLDDLKSLPQMENHGRRVMDQMSKLIEHIEDPKMLQEQLTWISTRHKPRKVSARQFKDMLAMFVEFTEQEMGSLFTPQHEIAWQHWLNYIVNVLEGEDSRTASGQNGDVIQPATPSASPVPLTPISTDAVDLTLEEPTPLSKRDAEEIKAPDVTPVVDSSVDSSTKVDRVHENSDDVEVNAACADNIKPCEEHAKGGGSDVDPVNASSENLRDEANSVGNETEADVSKKNNHACPDSNNSTYTDNDAKRDTNNSEEAAEDKGREAELNKSVDEIESLDNVEPNTTKKSEENKESCEVDTLVDKPNKAGVDWVDSGITTIIKNLCDNVVTPFNDVQHEKIKSENEEEIIKVDSSTGDTMGATKAALDVAG